MGVMAKELAKKLPAGMVVPEPIKLLYDWIESRKLTMKSQQTGGRLGMLYDSDDFETGCQEDERNGGTHIQFSAYGNEEFLEVLPKEHLSRLCQFARTGGDGSMAAFWLNDAGEQKIVHFGSGSGSCLICVLADDPVDFLRLIAIGYDEICFDEVFSKPPNSDDDYTVHPNVDFQEWVKKTFKVTIPKTASEIVKHPSQFGEERPKDEFAKWMLKVQLK